MGLFSRSKTSKPRALAFVDYEHWFYSYKNLFSMTPDLEAWRDELQEYFELEDILVFANFSVNLALHRNRAIRTTRTLSCWITFTRRRSGKTSKCT